MLIKFKMIKFFRGLIIRIKQFLIGILHMLIQMGIDKIVTRQMQTNKQINNNVNSIIPNNKDQIT